MTRGRQKECEKERGRKGGGRVGGEKRGTENQRGVKKMERARRTEIDRERGWKERGERRD